MIRALRVAALLAAVLFGRWAEAETDLPCVVCHPSRDRTAFDLLSDTPGVAVRSESAQAFLCYSCHNGSVVDSRLVLNRGGQHPTGIVPGRSLPKGFPLYPGGRMECGTCHSPHGTGAGARRWLRTGEGGVAGVCTACHGGKPESHLGARLSADAAKAIQAAGGEPGDGGRVECATCHRVHGASGPALLVAPYSAGREDLCLVCHPALGTKGTPSGTKGHPCAACHAVHSPRPDATGSPSGGKRCDSCHQGHGDRHVGLVLGAEAVQRTTGLGGAVGPGGKIQCATCHRVHGAATSRLLIAPYGPTVDELCRTCHARLSVKGAPVGEKSQPCADCHQPHVDTPRQFAGGGKSPCARCHADRARAGADHPAASPTCSDCHSIHRPFLPEGRKMGLLGAPLKGGSLCEACHPAMHGIHGPQTVLKDTDPAQLASRGIVLGSSGEVDCYACHALHGAKQAHLLRTPQLLLCLYCHPKENPYGPEGIRPGTHPVGVFLSRSQRKVLDFGAAVAPLAPEAGDVLECSSCHGAHRRPLARPVCRECHPVQGAAENHGGVSGCGACHSIHGGGAPRLTCGRCHEKTGTGPHEKNSSLSGTPGCTSCHDPHAASPRMLATKEPGEVCLRCHAEKRALLGGRHDRLATGGQGPCAPCHPAHGAPTPPGEDPVGARCRTCHPEDLRSLSDHGPTGAPAWKRVGKTLPLFDRQGKRNALGFVSCATCHDVHLGAGQGSTRLEARNPPLLCLACHPEKRSLLGSPHDPRAGGAGAACTVCHPVHSRGEQPRMWSLRAEAQGTWNDRKCSPCHGPPNSAPLRHAGPDSHPVNILAPDRMKPAELPFFDAMGGRVGRTVACSTCHDLHGREQAPGRRISKFLRKEPSNGDLCKACHVKEGGIVGTPHDLRSRWPSVTGPCGPCHVPHRAAGRQALWGLVPGPGEYPPNARCRSCHRQGGPVQGEFLLLQYHMKDAEAVLSPRATIYLQYPMTILDEWAVKLGKDPVIPLFDRKGNRSVEGNLQCVSCHDPHVWSPLGDFVKPGFGPVGPNVPTRFLRLRDSEALDRSACAACHPKDVEERYRKYHEVWEDLGPGFQ